MPPKYSTRLTASPPRWKIRSAVMPLAWSGPMWRFLRAVEARNRPAWAWALPVILLSPAAIAEMVKLFGGRR